MPFTILFAGIPFAWERPRLLQSPEMARPGISTKNTEKIPPGPKFWTPRILPWKYPENTEKNTPKIPNMTVFGIFSVFWGYFLGGPKFRPGGYFFGIFLWKFRVGPSRGSVAGGGILNPLHPSKIRGATKSLQCTMGAQKKNKWLHTHFFIVWELISQLHRTSVTHCFSGRNSFV